MRKLCIICLAGKIIHRILRKIREPKSSSNKFIFPKISRDTRINVSVTIYTTGVWCESREKEITIVSRVLIERTDCRRCYDTTNAPWMRAQCDPLYSRKVIFSKSIELFYVTRHLSSWCACCTKYILSWLLRKSTILFLVTIAYHVVHQANKLKPSYD